MSTLTRNGDKETAADRTLCMRLVCDVGLETDNDVDNIATTAEEEEAADAAVVCPISNDDFDLAANTAFFPSFACTCNQSRHRLHA